jgi:hypothetical protein
MSGDVGFMVDNVVLAQVCSEYFGFPCQFSLHQMLYIYISSEAGEMGTLVTGVPSGLSLIPAHGLKKGANQNYIRPTILTSTLKEASTEKLPSGHEFISCIMCIERRERVGDAKSICSQI